MPACCALQTINQEAHPQGVRLKGLISVGTFIIDTFCSKENITGAQKAAFIHAFWGRLKKFKCRFSDDMVQLQMQQAVAPAQV